jgi:PKD repeat protein
VEFALIAPVMLLLLLMAVDFGRLFFSYIEISNASREAAAYGAVYPTDSATMTAYARRETNSQGQGGESALAVATSCANSASVTIACTAAAGGSGTGNSVTVAVREQFSFLTPIIGAFFGGNLQISASSTAAVLGLVPNGGVTPPSDCAPPSLSSFTAVVTGLVVTLDASASKPDSGACAIAGYDWDMGDGLNPFPPVVNKQTSYTFATAGTYKIQLDVTNPGGTLTSYQFIPVGPDPDPGADRRPHARPHGHPDAGPNAHPDASLCHRAGLHLAE